MSETPNLDELVKMCPAARAELNKVLKCCCQRGARMQIMRTAWRETDWLHFCQDYGADDWFDDDGVPVR